MAKIDNWPKISRNIYFVKYHPDYLNRELLEELSEVRKKEKEILKKLGRTTEIYAPDRHPLFECGLLKEGKMITVADCMNATTHITERNSIQTVDFIDDVNSLVNFVSDSTLQAIDYNGEKYRRISATVYDEKEILRLSCVREKNI